MSLVNALVPEKSRGADLFEPIKITVVLYALYAGSLPIAVVISGGAEQLGLPAHSGGFAKYLAVCGLGLLGLVAGYYSPLRNVTERFFLRAPTVTRVWTWRYIALAYILVGYALVTLLANTAGGWTEFVAIGYGGQRYLAVEGRGYLDYGFRLIQVGAVISWILYLVHGRRFDLYAAAASAAPYVLYSFLVGNRGGILKLLVLGIVSWHYLRRRIRARAKAVVMATSLYVLLVLFGHVRGQVGVLAKIAYTRNFRWTWLNPFTGYGEFQAPARALWIAVSDEPDVRPLLGRSYVDAVLILTPKGLWSDRPQELAVWFAESFYPDIAAGGGGLGFFTLTEGYMNFGLVGAFAHMLVLGIVLGGAYQYLCRNRDRPAAVLLYGVIVAWIVIALRMDVSVSAKSLLYDLVPLLPLFFAGRGRCSVRCSMRALSRRSNSPALTKASSHGCGASTGCAT